MSDSEEHVLRSSAEHADRAAQRTHLLGLLVGAGHLLAFARFAFLVLLVLGALLVLLRFLEAVRRAGGLAVLLEHLALAALLYLALLLLVLAARARGVVELARRLGQALVVVGDAVRPADGEPLVGALQSRVDRARGRRGRGRGRRWWWRRWRRG
eukprot:scaffold128061_cov72-Phaeocystis_antarctica.AAC.5